MVEKLMLGLGPSVPHSAGTSGESVENVQMCSANSSLGLYGADREDMGGRQLSEHHVDAQRTSGYFQPSQLGLYNGTGMNIKKFCGRVKVL